MLRKFTTRALKSWNGQADILNGRTSQEKLDYPSHRMVTGSDYSIGLEKHVTP